MTSIVRMTFQEGFASTLSWFLNDIVVAAMLTTQVISSKLLRTLENDKYRRNWDLHLLLIFMPPKGGFKGCLLPSAKDVVLGRPLIIFQSKFPIISQTYHISRWHPSSDRMILSFFYTSKRSFSLANFPKSHSLRH